MEKTMWTYQQYDPVTGTAYPVPEDKETYTLPGREVTLYEPAPVQDPVDVWADVFAARDARRARCRIVAFQ